MAIKKLFRITKSGLAELQRELQRRTEDRTVIAERIKSARELGDLAENAEYQSARQEHERNEARINELEGIIQNAEVVSETPAGGSVAVGASVKLKASNGKSKDFQVVGTVEADPLNGKISDESPIGQALLGKKVGDEVEIKTPAETTSYKITEIS
jgi:transcription elongation factor GreA